MMSVAPKYGLKFANIEKEMEKDEAMPQKKFLLQVEDSTELLVEKIYKAKEEHRKELMHWPIPLLVVKKAYSEHKARLVRRIR